MENDNISKINNTLNIDYDVTLDRILLKENIKSIINDFDKNKNNLLIKRSIYIYGAPGCGKTTFVLNLLKELNYDVIKYDAGDVRNKNIIDTIDRHNMSDKNVISMFEKKVKKIAIVMDEIDGMNNGDKGGINSLIKLIRPKKTKKQKIEEISYNPIICISNYHIDKKIKELMKICHSIELKTPTNEQLLLLIKNIMPNLDVYIYENMINFIQGDLRKLNSIYSLYKNNVDSLNINYLNNIFKIKSYNEDTKEITKKIINTNLSLDEHNTIMNETDRTIVSLLWHENIIDIINKLPKNQAIKLYLKILENICYSDYIDRITFQKQIWQFNEMSSLIKTFYNNNILHNYFKDCREKINYNPQEVRFTKVLTKYSTEYNNSTFIQSLCQQLGNDKKDTFSYFLQIKEKYNDDKIYDEMLNYEISKLDVNRIYRYLDKYIKNNCSIDHSDVYEMEIEDDNDLLE
jgi:DNA polymerase III delta prime subunit